MQVVRGVLLWIVALLLTIPLAHVYSNMQGLVWIFPAVAATVLIAGFNSTALYTLNRNLMLGKLTALSIFAQVSGVVTMVGLAWHFTRTPGLEQHAPWALIAGSLVAQLIQTCASHFLDPKVRNRFAWDRTSAHAIFHFAKWVFVSTVLTYVILRLDHFLLARFLTQAQFGVYSIAQNFSTIMPQLVVSLGTAVMFPLLARVARDEPSRIRAQVQKARSLVLIPAACFSALLIVLGPDLIHILYKPAYHDAGWKLQILASASFAMIIATSYGAALMALGRSDQIVWLLVSMLGFLLTGVLTGQYFFGTVGFMIGLAAAEWLNYPLVAMRARRQGVYTPKVDAVVFGIGIAAITIAFLRR
jgi:O-antigen/teichoic acid export membrane protein